MVNDLGKFWVKTKCFFPAGFLNTFYKVICVVILQEDNRIFSIAYAHWPQNVLFFPLWAYSWNVLDNTRLTICLPIWKWQSGDYVTKALPKQYRCFKEAPVFNHAPPLLVYSFAEGETQKRNEAERSDRFMKAKYFMRTIKAPDTFPTSGNEV